MPSMLLVKILPLHKILIQHHLLEALELRGLEGYEGWLTWGKLLMWGPSLVSLSKPTDHGLPRFQTKRQWEPAYLRPVADVGSKHG